MKSESPQTRTAVPVMAAQRPYENSHQTSQTSMDCQWISSFLSVWIKVLKGKGKSAASRSHCHTIDATGYEKKVYVFE